MSNWETIKAYQRAGFNSRFAVMMDVITNGGTLGAESGTDSGLTNHNLVSHMTDAAGNVWTVQSVGALASGQQCSANTLTFTISASNSFDPDNLLKGRTFDGTLTGSGLKMVAD